MVTTGTGFLFSRRLQPVRRLSRAECELLEYAGPLFLARVEHRVPWGPWRPAGGYVVVRHPDQVLMDVTREQLAARGIPLDGDARRS